MAYELHLTPRALLSCRFAISPVWETTHLVKLLRRSRPQQSHLPWLETVRDLAAELDLTDLAALQPVRGWTPDFITPTPESPEATIGGELARVRLTTAGAVTEDLKRTLRDQPDPQLKARIAELLQDPAAARERVAGLIQRCWDVLVRPEWPRLRDLLSADIAHHTRTLADGGLLRLLPQLHGQLSLRQDTLVLRRSPAGRARELEVDELVLMPSAFLWPSAAVLLDGPRPAIVYPARGVGDLRPPEAGVAEHAALPKLLGRARATLLADLGEPASTTTLARRHGLSPAGVSAHLSVLRASGLVSSRRDRHEVLYRRTELGSSLVAGNTAD